jgi:hypothetical protein
VPAVQLVHVAKDDDPLTVEKVPAGHPTQVPAELAPGVVEYVPSVQLVHDAMEDAPVKVE